VNSLPNPMKKIYIIPLIGIALLVLIIIKIFGNTKKEKAALATPTVQTVHAECYVAGLTQADYSFRAVGRIKPNESVNLVSELSLRLLKINFREGSRVKKGELLFQLDDSEWQASIDKVQARLDLARETEKRNQVLLGSGGTSQQVYDESVSNRKVLEAEVKALHVLIEKAKIKAPFSGTIGIRNISEGAFLTPGIVLTSLDDLSKLKLDFTIPESYATTLKTGDPLNFRIDGIPDVQEAVIEAIDPSIDAKTGVLRLLAIVRNPHPSLKAGVAVSLEINVKSAAPSLYIPTQALIPTPGGYSAYVLKGGKATYGPVTTGIRAETMVEILNGIVPGDSVLVTGFMKVRPGSVVKIIKVW